MERNNENVFKEDNEYYPTEVKGLDRLYRNGLVFPPSGNGLVILIKGKPGTGKSTLALQISAGSSKWKIKGFNRKVRYFTCEQARDDILKKCKSYNIEFRGNLITNNNDAKVEISNEIPYNFSSSSILMWANEMTNLIIIENENQSNGNKIQTVVIDGLNLLSHREKLSIEIDNIIRILRKNCKLVILVYEPLPHENSNIDSMVDMIIEMKGSEIKGPTNYFINQLNISKSRFQPSVLGWHQYKIIDDEGVVVFPSIHFYMHKPDLMNSQLKDSLKPIINLQREEINIEEENSLIAEILKTKDKENLRKGSCTVILGERTTCKTLITLDFLREGGNHNKKGLLISLLDNRNTIMDQISCDRCGVENCAKFNKKRKKCYKNVYLLHFNPGCITSNEFFSVLKQRIEKTKDKETSSYSPKWKKVFLKALRVVHLTFPDCTNTDSTQVHGSKKGFREKTENEERENRESFPIDRVAFWDLVQLEYRFPFLSNDPMFLTALIEYFKSQGITLVLHGSLSCKHAKEASVVADNVISLSRGYYRDNKDKNSEGIFVNAYRIEGCPGVKKFIFLEFKKDDKVYKQVGGLKELHITGDEGDPLTKKHKEMTDEIKFLH